MLREHYRKNHHVCEFKECQMLVFEDNVVLNEHYNIVHGQKRTTQVVFGFSMRDDDDEEEKVINPVPSRG